MTRQGYKSWVQWGSDGLAAKSSSLVWYDFLDTVSKTILNQDSAKGKYLLERRVVKGFTASISSLVVSWFVWFSQIAENYIFDRWQCSLTVPIKRDKDSSVYGWGFLKSDSFETFDGDQELNATLNLIATMTAAWKERRNSAKLSPCQCDCAVLDRQKIVTKGFMSVRCTLHIFFVRCLLCTSEQCTVYTSLSASKVFINSLLVPSSMRLSSWHWFKIALVILLTEPQRTKT